MERGASAVSRAICWRESFSIRKISLFPFAQEGPASPRQSSFHPPHAHTAQANHTASTHHNPTFLSPSHSLTRAPPILPRKQHTPISPPPPQHLPKPPRAPPTPAHLAEISSAAGTLLLPSRRYASQCLTRWARLSSRRETGFSSASGARGAWVAKVCRARDGDACSAIYRLLKESLRGGVCMHRATEFLSLFATYLPIHPHMNSQARVLVVPNGSSSLTRGACSAPSTWRRQHVVHPQPRTRDHYRSPCVASEWPSASIVQAVLGGGGFAHRNLTPARCVAVRPDVRLVQHLCGNARRKQWVGGGGVGSGCTAQSDQRIRESAMGEGKVLC